MADAVAAAEKSPNAWAQAVAAVVLISALGGGLWALQKTSAHNADEPATCSADKKAKPSKRVSGTELCTALNRTDLPTLLGTPQEQAETAHGSQTSFELPSGTRIAIPEATVTLETYSVKLSRSYDDLPIAGTTDRLSSPEKKTVLGHPAVLYSDRTIALSFSLGGGKAESGPGGIARTLQVAPDPKDGGGSFEIAIWRQDSVVPDDAALLRVAEKVLPTLPGWTTTG
ncbi:DUF6215 domain-containing protein [Streptomyces sp. NPDC086549]|uniref:DUF6215 domain-containing protein n=1 Tax=Streptomyces sp. NPDC086549 TaxID=3365752 RepID=UPI00381B3BDD